MTDMNIDRRTYLTATTAAAAGMIGFAGCTGTSTGTSTGTLATQVTDQPGDITDFESCVVTIEGIWLGPESDETDDDDEPDDDDESDDENNETVDDENNETVDDENNETVDDDADDDEDDDDDTDDDDDDDDDDGREYHEFDEPQEADLVELQGENTQLVDERELDTGTYNFLQLDVSGVDATLDDGSSAEVRVPGEAPLKFNESFEIREDTQTVFTGDFTPVKRGQSGRYNLQPVARGTTVEYVEGEEDDDEDDSETGDGEE